ncbi:MAG: 2-keto-3-deoxygluconate permease [Archaeoglobus sp.]|nr:2-keto-3-deoxygluconate permease [Archaeoglobus sp.]
MIEYLLSLVLGFTAGFLIERLKGVGREKEFLSKGMTASLFFLIFFLGLDIGRKLDLSEMIQVGKLSIVFAVMTMVFSYTASKILLRGFRCSSR